MTNHHHHPTTLYPFSFPLLSPLCSFPPDDQRRHRQCWQGLGRALLLGLRLRHATSPRSEGKARKTRFPFFFQTHESILLANLSIEKTRCMLTAIIKVKSHSQCCVLLNSSVGEKTTSPSKTDTNANGNYQVPDILKMHENTLSSTL